MSFDDLIHDRAVHRAAWEDDADITRIVARVAAALNSGRDRAVVEVVLDETETLRAKVWADAAATLNDHADVWEADGSDPCRVRVCRSMANAFRTYAEGVGIPAIDSLRKKRKDAEAEVETLRARLAAVEAEVAKRDVPYPKRFVFGASENYVDGYKAALTAIRAALGVQR